MTMVLSLPPVPVDALLAFARCMLRALPPMKVSSTSTGAPELRQLHERAFLHGGANAVHHEPCGALSDAYGAGPLRRS